MAATTAHSKPPPTDLGTVAAFVSKTGTDLDPLYEASYVGGTHASPALSAISRTSEAAERLGIELENIGATARVRIFHDYQKAREYAVCQRTALNALRDVRRLESVIGSFGFSPKTEQQAYDALRTIGDRLEDISHNRSH